MNEPMNDHRSEESIGVLCAIMRMIPAGPVRIGDEAVGEITSRGNRALAHRRNAIKPRTYGTPQYILVMFLQHTMPVYRGAFFVQDSTLLFSSRFDPIVNSNLKGVSPISCDSWPWEASVNQDQAFIKTIGLEVASSDDEIVGHRDVGDRCVFAVRVGSRCDSLILWKAGRDAIGLFVYQKSWSEGIFILPGTLTVFASKKRGRSGASDVPSIESPESVSYSSCPKIERLLAVGCILTQGSCCSEAAKSAIQKVGYQPHVEIFCSRFRSSTGL